MIQATLDKTKAAVAKRPLITGATLAVLLPALLSAGVNSLNLTIGDTHYSISLTGQSEVKKAQQTRDIVELTRANANAQAWAACEQAVRDGKLDL